MSKAVCARCKYYIKTNLESCKPDHKCFKEVSFVKNNVTGKFTSVGDKNCSDLNSNSQCKLFEPRLKDSICPECKYHWTYVGTGFGVDIGPNCCTLNKDEYPYTIRVDINMATYCPSFDPSLWESLKIDFRKLKKYF